jgi:hypothetical protein
LPHWLLFLKRINDHFDEETEEIAEEYDVDEETVRNDRSCRASSGCNIGELEYE